MADAREAGLPPEYMEDAVRVANALAVARAEISADYLRLEGEAEDSRVGSDS